VLLEISLNLGILGKVSELTILEIDVQRKLVFYVKNVQLKRRPSILVNSGLPFRMQLLVPSNWYELNPAGDILRF
jgi:hypothetical protein